MLGLRPGPRQYKVFISHRYNDDAIYGDLRRHLVNTNNFKFSNLSLEVDRQLNTASPGATKKSISSRIKKADALLVFAHSTGVMVEHEVDKAKHYGVPVISVVDPTRANEKYRHARCSHIAAGAVCEVSLDQPNQIVAAIRRHARPQNGTASRHLQLRPVATTAPDHEVANPSDIELRLSRTERRESFVSRIRALLFGRIDPERDRRI